LNVLGKEELEKKQKQEGPVEKGTNIVICTSKGRGGGKGKHVKSILVT